jgi:hypothetical protein
MVYRPVHHTTAFHLQATSGTILLVAPGCHLVLNLPGHWVSVEVHGAIMSKTNYWRHRQSRLGWNGDRLLSRTLLETGTFAEQSNRPAAGSGYDNC